MKVMTISGPPSSGKTSVALKVAPALSATYRLAVAKFDCLTSRDAPLYEAAGLPVVAGVSGALCPDHFFATNMAGCMDWAQRQEADVLLVESAGLCNRCAPHLRDAVAVCVIDVLAGIDAPRKVGPMLRLADFVVVTKADLVSQPEREVFALNVVRANPRAHVLFVNGLTGQGACMFESALLEALAHASDNPHTLRFTMPGAVCSYCFGETGLGTKHASGNIKYMDFPDEKPVAPAAVHANREGRPR